MIRHRIITPLVVLLVFASAQLSLSNEPNEFGTRSSWSVPRPDSVQEQVRTWLKTLPLEQSTGEELLAMWDEVEDATPEALLDRLAETMARTDEAARLIIQMCRSTPSIPLADQSALLNDPELTPFVRHHLRLIYGHWLAQHNYYDEARIPLDGLLPKDVIDPSTLLFYQSVVQHRLLEKANCLATLATLLENEGELPRRYSRVARLMEADIRPMKVDSLDEIARLMEDIERRLRFARAGTRVRKQEDDVIAKLDKLIEAKEGGGEDGIPGMPGAGPGGSRAMSPAADSVPLGGRGPGDVDQKKIGTKSGWGNLPPKARQEALQQISKDLPAHFRDVIEEYLERLAHESGSQSK
jgi:hypothetical protein